MGRNVSFGVYIRYGQDLVRTAKPLQVYEVNLRRVIMLVPGEVEK
jgi:hypothetical protein